MRFYRATVAMEGGGDTVIYYKRWFSVFEQAKNHRHGVGSEIDKVDGNEPEMTAAWVDVVSFPKMGKADVLALLNNELDVQVKRVWEWSPRPEGDEEAKTERLVL